MTISFTAFIVAFGAVVLAEMGDKTQLLAMAFATRYKASKVLLGVFIATVFNHALAVIVGNYITHIQSAQTFIQGIASLSFIFFGLWTIRGDKLEGEENKTTKFGAVITVAAAFFLAEMGDKTQLATIAIATRFPESPAGILLGTTAGMLVADGIGIIVGVVLCKKIPERTIKLISAGVFVLFGFLGVYQTLKEQLNMNAASIAAILGLLLVITGISGYYLIKKSKSGEDENPAENQYCNVKLKNPGSENR